MERYYGFDLGDAESAVAVLRSAERGGSSKDDPELLPVSDGKSFITAYARRTDGALLIGESACYAADVTARGLRFKSRFLTDPDSEGDIRTFAAGVLSSLIQNGYLIQGGDFCMYIGCPAGWKKADRERYRRLFEKAGFPPVRIVSESRAALIAACQSRYLQVGYDILSKPVLVVDVGSSTTDFAYVEGGMEVELQTSGEVMLGGGLMDEMILERAVASSPDAKTIREIFEKNRAWRTYCEFAARRLKEKYFADESYWKSRICSRTLQILDSGRSISLTILMNQNLADRILTAPNPKLQGKSFQETFCRSFQDVTGKIEGRKPEIVLLTGGVSQMEAIRSWCEKMAPDAVVVTGRQPQFSVAKGLAYSGRIDEDMKQFRKEVSDLIDSSTVEQIVGKQIDGLYRQIVDTMVDPILDSAVMTVFLRWREGEVPKLTDVDAQLQEEIEHYLRSDDAQRLLAGVIAKWLRPIAYELEDYTMPICARHNVPYRALNLTSYLSLTDVDIQIDTRNIFAVDEITWLINAIISVIVGLLCGGSGIALIAGGLKGIVAGTVLSLMILVLGQDYMEEHMMNIRIPKPIRKLVTKKQFESRIHRTAPEVKARFYESLEKVKNEEISTRMTDEISRQIEQCLGRMAEIVEIPLG